MRNNKEIIEILEKAVEDSKKIQQEHTKQEDFEVYIRTRLDKIADDVDKIKKSIIG